MEIERDPQGRSRIEVKNTLRVRLERIRDAWTGVNRRRLSTHNVIEILAKLVPGKLTREEIDAVELETRPAGRPKKLVKSKDCPKCKGAGVIKAGSIYLPCGNCVD